jgi:hypothetical protein
LQSDPLKRKLILIGKLNWKKKYSH